MRLSVAAAIGLCIVCARPAYAQTSFPYKAYVIAKDAYVRAGPGGHYYPTEKLQPGDQVEVYRHEPGGWYAIRPLPDSFTWVSGEYLKPGEDGLAEVIAQRVPARVGSHFSDIRDVVQVWLDQGEIVELKGSKQVGVGQEAVTWYKISPPAGEFRWIAARDVEPDPAPCAVRRAEAHTARVPGRGPDPIHGEPATGSEEVSGGPAGPEARSMRPAGRAASATLAAPVSPTLALGEPSAEPAGPRVPASALRRVSPEAFQAELDDINAQLAIMLSEEPTAWNCEELASRAHWLLQQAETALERGRARVLVNRIAQAENIKRRLEQVETLRVETDQRNWQLAELARIRTEQIAARTGQERFDGVGRLSRVAPSKPGAPRYALVDEQGNVRCYVSPAPGLNMQYYLGRRVGVNGPRGYIAQGKAMHITAKHVTVLDSRLR